MEIKDWLRTVFSSKTKTADDGRDQWPSRTSFILAAMGGCVGLGNILRYVSRPAMYVWNATGTDHPD
jgi:hypothetical protein